VGHDHHAGAGDIFWKRHDPHAWQTLPRVAADSDQIGSANYHFAGPMTQPNSGEFIDFILDEHAG
jgi:hypothetical protein